MRGRVGQEWETRAAEEREMSREPWEVSLLRHSGGTVQWTLSPVPPREEKSTGMRTSRSLFVLQHGRRERQRTRRRFRGDAANAVSTDAAELAKVSLTSRLPFTSCQIKRWRGSGGLEAKRGIQSAFRCERKKDTSEPGRVNVLFVPLRFSPCCFRSVDCADTSSNAHHTGASAAQRSNSGGQSCTKLIYKSSPPGATQTGCYNQLISVSFVGLGGFKSNIVQLIWPFE